MPPTDASDPDAPDGAAKPAAKPTDKPAHKPAHKPADKPAAGPAKRGSDKRADKPAAGPANPAAGSDKRADKPAARRRSWRVGRLRPAAYRAVRTAHIVVSGGWLGVGLGKLVLEVAALTAGSAQRAAALFAAATEIGCAFPPMILGTLLTGVTLAVGTRWGLLRYYWVITKLALTLAVVATAMALVDGWADQALAIHPDGVDPPPGFGLGPLELLAVLSGVYMAMLLAATVVSVYKPWGRIAWR